MQRALYLIAIAALKFMEYHSSFYLSVAFCGVCDVIAIKADLLLNRYPINLASRDTIKCDSEQNQALVHTTKFAI